MQSSSKIDFETFYRKLLDKFPELNKNPVWHQWDWSNESCEQSVVISEVAREMIKWAENEEWPLVEDLLTEVEAAFKFGTYPVISFLGTDFTVTVMECRNSEVRKRIKQLMGDITLTAYQMNLRGFSEE